VRLVQTTDLGPPLTGPQQHLLKDVFRQLGIVRKDYGVSQQAAP
jgi:hypothetical protein